MKPIDDGVKISVTEVYELGYDDGVDGIRCSFFDFSASPDGVTTRELYGVYDNGQYTVRDELAPVGVETERELPRRCTGAGNSRYGPGKRS